MIATNFGVESSSVAALIASAGVAVVLRCRGASQILRAVF